MKVYLPFSFVLFLKLLFVEAEEMKKPHIIVLMADDLGYNDVGYNNKKVKTPEIDDLAKNGIKLTNHYANNVCTPSRHAFLTGRYPFRDGLQHIVITADRKVCSNISLDMLPKRLKEKGYATHMLGKWHLGFCNEACLPNQRGFDTFMGNRGSHIHQYTKIESERYDFWKGNKVYQTQEYSTDLYMKRADEILTKHDADEPFFLYYAFNEPHAPLVKTDYEKDFTYKEKARNTYLGMVQKMDSAIGKLIKKLKAKKMYDNSFIVFISDNGGDVEYAGNNYPYRGGKVSYWEGGSKTPALVSGGYIKTNADRMGERNGLMYIADWFPTFLIAADIEPHGKIHIDGVNQLPMILLNQDSRRDEIIYNLDIHEVNGDVPPFTGHVGLRKGKYKYVQGYPGGVVQVLVQSPEFCEQGSNQEDVAACSNYEGGISKGLDFSPKVFFKQMFAAYEKMKEDGTLNDEYLFNLDSDKSEAEPIKEKKPLEKLKDRVWTLMAQVPYQLFPTPTPGAPKERLDSDWCTVEELLASQRSSLLGLGTKGGVVSHKYNSVVTCVCVWLVYYLSTVILT